MNRNKGQSDEETKEIWLWIRWWKKEFNFSSEELARRTNYPKERIDNGLNGIPEPVRHVLDKFVMAFGLDLVETRDMKADGGQPSYEEYKAFLRPTRELTPSEKLSDLEMY